VLWAHTITRLAPTYMCRARGPGQLPCAGGEVPRRCHRLRRRSVAHASCAVPSPAPHTPGLSAGACGEGLQLMLPKGCEVLLSCRRSQRLAGAAGRARGTTVCFECDVRGGAAPCGCCAHRPAGAHVCACRQQLYRWRMMVSHASRASAHAVATRAHFVSRRRPRNGRPAFLRYILTSSAPPGVRLS